jgi:PKD repeat protein
MNKLTEFEKIINGKIQDFEYSYDEAAWAKMNKILWKKIVYARLPFFAGGIIILVAGLIAWYLNIPDLPQNNVNTTSTQTGTLIPEQNSSVIFESPVSTGSKNNIQVINPKQNQTTIDNPLEPMKQNVEAPIPVNDENSVRQFMNNMESHPAQTFPELIFMCDQYEGCVPLNTKCTPSIRTDSLIYLWNFGDGTTVSELIPSHNYSKEGKYTITLSLKSKTNGQVLRTANKDITVFEKPNAHFTYSVTSNLVSFQNISSNAMKYKWILADTISTDDDLVKYFTKSGSYNVKLVAIGSNGCSDEFSSTIDVKVKLIYQLAKDFTPNGDGDNDYFGPQVMPDNDYHFTFRVYDVKTNKKVWEASGSADDVKWNGQDGNHHSVRQGYYSYEIFVKDRYGNTEKSNNIFELKTN